MAEYINRDVLIDALQNHYAVRDARQNAIVDECVMIALKMPVADVRENVYGKWKYAWNA